VLSPIEAAERRVDRESAEVAAERDAYEQFSDRVAGIATVTTPQSQLTPTPRLYVDAHPPAAEQLRSAFRATVMSVDHYDDVYDESLPEYVAAELSDDIATVFADDLMTPFMEPAKTTLTTAIQRAINGREQFLDVLDQERASLKATHCTLADLLNEQDGPQVPNWYRPEFETTLEELADQRQETLHDRPAIARTDGHDLCTYLYQDQAWTYPVLTALARFRRTAL